jgi:16S rRNA (guanine(966)-N(2))-methyltransferase RsmD
VADLFAGSGALGIEALSRGAAHALFVENSAHALRALRRNIEELDVVTQARVLAQDVRRALPALVRERAEFDVIFADPPYAAREWMGLAEQREFVELLCPGGVLVVERARRGAPEPAAHVVHGLRELVLRESRGYGETMFDWYDLREETEA